MAGAGARGALAVLVAGVVLAVGVSLVAATTTSRSESQATGVWATQSPTSGPVVGSLRDAGSGFVHPGVLVSSGQLEFVAGKVRAREEPWYSALRAVQRSRYSQLDWQPKPYATVDCGFYGKPAVGCTEETDDATAAYLHALLWYFTGDRRHAKKSVEIIDAWSEVLKRHTNTNGPLQAGWSGASFSRAAELMRYTWTGWPQERIDRAERMFRKVYLPTLSQPLNWNRAGNWELIMMDAAVGISVFLDDRSAFGKAVNRWRKRLPAYIYLPSDGPVPKSPPGKRLDRQEVVAYWGDQSRFVTGLAQETCRDFLHTGWGLAAAAHVAETAWIQGFDLYAEARPRLTAAMELHAAYELDEPVPNWLCGGQLALGLAPSPEVAYNHYTTRMGLKLPRTTELVVAARPAQPGMFYAAETLTHAGNPS
ncbi:alginate lyase family protein [Micromonospora siamensis]|uniref:Alginate lyase n=1 Tax=Micromonospora siamensis TaxID=299152 RepID=A0A1C5HJ63_9ACTN|nr:alginate lyase family protein [Micromonospora siamensis]SCG46024.1 Alginate lyase [Micromonospora siamensis]